MGDIATLQLSMAKDWTYWCSGTNQNQFIAPHHINFFNTSSIAKLAESTGFKVLEVTTPGKLDIDIMKNSIADINDRFWRFFVENANEELSEKMQQVIRENNLSSHMMIVLQKRKK